MAISKKQRQRMKRALKLQIPFPFDIDRFLDRAIRQFPEDPASFAYALIINSKVFERHYPGIKRGDGTLRINPAEYTQRKEAFQSTAAQFGFSLNRRQIGALVGKNVDPQEFVLRAQGVQQLRSNPDTVKFVNRQIALINQRRNRAGVDARIPLIRNNKQALNFFTGRADRTVYAAYEGALFQQSAADAGVPIGAGRAARLAKGTAGVLDVEEIEQGFAGIAAQLRLAGVELRAAGISARDLEILEFGGPGRGEIRQKAERVLAQRQAALQPPPPTQARFDERGRPITGIPGEPGF